MQANWTKADGALIRIRFDQDIAAPETGDAEHFSVAWSEYEFVPGGALVSKSATPLDAFRGNSADELILEMPELRRFNNAVVVQEQKAGKVVKLSDGVEGIPLKSLQFSVNPYQEGSGTPGVSNIRPISGADAAEIHISNQNYFNSSFEQGSIRSANGRDTPSTTRCRCGYSPLAPGTYVFGIAEGLHGRVYFYDRGFAFLGTTPALENPPLRFSAPQYTEYIRLVVAKADDSLIVPEDISEVWIADDALESYFAHRGADYAISFPQRIYGGKGDALSGAVRSNMALLTLDGTEDWISYQSNSYFYLRIGAYNTVVADEAICSHLPENPDIAGSNNKIGFRVYNRSASSVRMAALLMRFDSTKAQTLEEFTAYLAAQYAAGTPVQVCYTLTEAEEIQLAPVSVKTLEGENRLWCNVGNVDAAFALSAIKVEYDGLGMLRGAGDVVAPFVRYFLPDGLIAKPNQNPAEHLKIDAVSATGILTRIFYRDTAETEHIAISNITVTGSLINVGDL